MSYLFNLSLIPSSHINFGTSNLRDLFFLIDIILFYLIIILYTKIKMFDPNYKNYQDNRQLTLYDVKRII